MAAYKVTGSGEPLLLLHGALVTRTMWQPQTEAFRKDYRVITCDFPAHGESPDISGDYTIAKLSEFVIQLLDTLGVIRAHVCGHSMGGMVAQHLAFTHPEHVQKVVLAETALGTQNSLWERVQTSLARFFLSLTPQKSLVELSAKQYGSLNAHVGEFVRREMDRFEHSTSMRVMGAALRFSSKQHLGNIRAPTLVLVADGNRRTHAQGRELAERIRDAEFVILPESNHLLNLDNADAFNTAVLTFLKE